MAQFDSLISAAGAVERAEAGAEEQKPPPTPKQEPPQPTPEEVAALEADKKIQVAYAQLHHTAPVEQVNKNLISLADAQEPSEE